MTKSNQFRDLRYSRPCYWRFMSSRMWHCHWGSCSWHFEKDRMPQSSRVKYVFQGTGTFLFYSLTLKLKTQHSFQMSGTTQPVTHHIPEVQHPQYSISPYISNTALSVTTKGLRNNHKNLRRAKTGSWNFQNKRQKCWSLDSEMWVLLTKTEIFVCFCLHFNTLYYKYNSYTLGIYFFTQCCSNSEHWQ